MNKRLLLNALCCFGLLVGSANANEFDSVDSIRISLGDRKGSDAQFAEDLQRRLEDSAGLQAKGINEENANFNPSEELLIAREKCLEEGLFEDKDGSAPEKAQNVTEKAAFLTTHPGALHFVTAVTLPYGDPVQLEDGSIWSLYTGDNYKTLNWLTTDNILIIPNRNPVWYSIYPYCLLNQQTGVSVQASPCAAPWYNGFFSRWIYSIDYYNCQLLLNDGSIWNVPYSDSWILNGFLPGDYVIMGFNDFPGNGQGSNILINFSTLQYVYSSCIYY